jgi:phage protein D
MISLLSSRKPVLRLLVNGYMLSGVIEADVISSGNFSADRFDAKIALDNTDQCGAPFWASQVGIQIEILVGFDEVNFTSLIMGVVDTVTIDPIKGLLRISGRDLSAKLIDTHIQGTFSNQTSSEIAISIAQRHGLSPNVTRTNALVGRYYQNEHDKISLDQFSQTTTDWDLLTFLARHEGFGLSVIGNTLNFGPPVQSLAPAYLITPADCIGITLERRLSLAGNIEVVVKSWSSCQKSAFVQSVRANSQSGGMASQYGTPQRYVYIYPNLTPDQALQFAQGKLSELTVHERTIEAFLPGDLLLAATGMLQLSETCTEFDQLYFIDSIERRISADSGFTQFVRAKNSSTTSPSD